MILFLFATAMLIAVLTFFELRCGDRLNTSRTLNLQVFVFDKLLRFFAVPFVALHVPFRMLEARDMPFWAGVLIYVLAGDLFAYLFHRAQHAIPFMWAMHSLHHSDESMNATTTERHFWADQFLKSMTSFPLASLIIAPTPEIVAVNLVLTQWNYIAHANIKWTLGRWSWLIMCPAYHRRHHSALPEHFNSNYAAIFPIWDVIAGSYHPAYDYPPTGLPDKPRGFSDAILWPLLRFGSSPARSAR